MKTRNPLLTPPGVLSIFAISAMLGYATLALEASPGRLGSSIAQEPQHPANPPQPPDQTQPDSNAVKSSVFTGTVVKDGSDFVLRLSSGDFYHLDAPGKAQPFEGKSVKVIGKLDPNAKVIHVEDIQEMSAA